ncbi:MAG: phosphoribosyltransferase [Planctomycetota bacterium]
MDTDPLFGADEIRATVRRIAADIRSDLGDVRPLLVGVLNGAFVFLSDLIRELGVPLEVDFVRARSYGKSMTSSGKVEITKDLEADPAGRHVIVVEDIADTGLTLDAVVAYIESLGPASVRRCALLVREGCPAPDYPGFTIGEGFVVGYGIDHAEAYRHLVDIRIVRGSD